MGGREILSGMAHGPAVALAATLSAFHAAQLLQRRWPRVPLLHPTLVTVILVATFLSGANESYATYLTNVQVLSFMLAPTVVLLAVPLHRRLGVIRRSWRVLAAGVAVGLPAGVLSTVWIVRLCGADGETLRTLLPKSVTSGMAIGVSRAIGGDPGLTVVFVIASGIVGAAFGPWLLRLLAIRDPRACGLAIGVGGHGIGTARALQLGETMGAFSSVGMALNGIAQAILLPLACALLLTAHPGATADAHPDARQVLRAVPMPAKPPALVGGARQVDRGK